MTDWLQALSLTLHILATVVWIGGLLLATFLLWPEMRAMMARAEQGAALYDLLDRLRRRFYPISNVSLTVLIVTGMIQMSHSPFYEGFFVVTNDWSRAILVKHIAILAMIGVGAFMQWRILPALERASLLISRGKPADMDRLRGQERRLTLINCGLGVIVLVCSAIAGAVR